MWTSEAVCCDGDQWFADLCASLAAAQRRIWLETYILAPDPLGERVVAALRAAAARGCEVRLLVDGVGAAAWLRGGDPGVELRVWNPLPWAAARRAGLFRRWRWLAAINRRDHRKVCLVDDRLAWVGSFNIDGCHVRELSGGAAWRDSGACVSGDGVAELGTAFELAWRKAWPVVGGRMRLWSRIQRPAASGQQSPTSRQRPAASDVRLNHTWSARRAAYRDLLSRLRAARARIWISNAYIVPRGSFLRALQAAVRRGVDVRLLAPARSDVPFMPWVGAIYADALRSRGVRVFAYLPRMLHAKTMLIDGTALVGSHNLNSRSFLHDLEAEVVLTAPASLATLEQAFAADCAESRELVGAAGGQLPWWQRWIGRIMLLAKRWL
jgi:cardiolipin synthase